MGADRATRRQLPGRIEERKSKRHLVWHKSYNQLNRALCVNIIIAIRTIVIRSLV